MINFKEINNRIEIKKGSLDELIEFLLKELYVKNPNGNYVTDPYYTFLLSLDKFTPMLYRKDSIEGYYAIELNKYTDGGNGYFDKLFKVASLLIRFLIVSDIQEKDGEKVKAENWNIILKMDTHNNPQGKSRYSLVTSNNEFIIKDNTCKSLAYTLFFDYFDFCNSKYNERLPKNNIYTVHKEFINEKTACSFAYEIFNNAPQKRTDGGNLKEPFELTNIDESDKLGKKHYLDFIHCILDKSFIKKDASPFSNYLLNDKKSWERGSNSMKSFSYFNLGIPGFESWGTLMIESNDDAITVYNKFYRKGEDHEESLLLSKIKNVISALKKIDDEYNDALNKQKIRQESIKSAKAAIMSRNMSHNIGSHVMSYLKQKLGSITSILSNENKVLYNLTDDKYLLELLKQKELDENATLQELLIKNLRELLQKSETNGNDTLQDLITKNILELQKKDNYEANTDNGTIEQTIAPNQSLGDGKSTKIKKTKKPIQFPFLVGTGRFIGYIQERQDYIATIATDYIPYGAPINLKDAVYDELNPDLRHMRHNDDDGNRPMNVLLSFIAKSEGLSRENMKKDNSEARFDTENDILFGFPKYESADTPPHIFGLSPTQCESNHPALTEMRKINFSLPGGLVGRQAIFSIVENLIRNAAKHGDPRSTKPDYKGNLELTFDIIDLANIDDCICIDQRICDPIWRMLYKSACDREQLYLLTITDNLTYETDSEGNTLVDRLRPALVEDYLDEQGNMRPTNKGIKEIRISAAWIRNEIDENRYLKYSDFMEGSQLLLNKKAPLVGLEFTKDGHLRYMFCVPQDRLCAVVTEGMNNEDLKLFTELHDYSEKDWKLYKTIDEVKNDNKISFHYMLVANENLYNLLRPVTSNRLFVWNPSQEKRQRIIIERQQETNTGKKYKLTKNAIVRTLFGINDNNESIYIWDEKAYANYEDNPDTFKNKIEASTSDDKGVTVAKYVYRTHHSTENQFMDYWKKKSQSEGEFQATYNEIFRIDAITGDNSSDRIVRREPLNEEWYCSHIRALNKRVAIFDERLFKIVHNVEESKFVVKKQIDSEITIESLLKRLKDNENLKSITDEIVEKKLLGEESERMVRLSPTAEKLISNLEKRITLFHPYNGNKSNYKSIVYEEKGVDVFTIIKEKENTFVVVGYVSNETDNSGELKKILYDKIATITSTRNPFEVKIDFHYTEFAKQYDYISIHQGILDKIYEGFGIKEHGEENDSRKCVVTHCIHKEFMKANEYEPISVTDENGNHKEDFLPCFIIHSGRAKPTKNDMPQEQPFIQYAAIEHGVQDCKYALVELLDYARYEN